MVDSNVVYLCELLPVADDSFRLQHSCRLRPHAHAPGDLPRRHPRCLHLHGFVLRSLSSSRFCSPPFLACGIYCWLLMGN
jgi:hypothetical protein